MGVAYTHTHTSLGTRLGLHLLHILHPKVVNLVSFMFSKITESHQQLRSLQCCFGHTTTITKYYNFNSIQDQPNSHLLFQYGPETGDRLFLETLAKFLTEEYQSPVDVYVGFCIQQCKHYYYGGERHVWGQ